VKALNANKIAFKHPLRPRTSTGTVLQTRSRYKTFVRTAAVFYISSSLITSNTPRDMGGCPQLLFGGAAIASGRFGLLKEVQDLLELLRVVGISRIDIAPIYPVTSPGDAEQLLGQCAPSGFTIDTKIMVTDMTGKGTLKADAIETSIIASLKRLNTDVCCLFPQSLLNLTISLRSILSTVTCRIRKHHWWRLPPLSTDATRLRVSKRYASRKPWGNEH